MEELKRLLLNQAGDDLELLSAVVIEQDLSKVPDQILILPRGELRWRKGSEEGTLLVDDEAIASVITHFNSGGVKMVIDYEHQTQNSQKNGKEAPAAGFIDRLYADAAGLWGHVERWTKTAADYLAQGAYRYHSPALGFSKADRRVRQVDTVGLTNFPATVGANSIAFRYDPEFKQAKEDENMALLLELAKLHGLPETASEEEVMAAVKKAKEKEPQRVEVYPIALKRELGLPDDAPDDKVKLTLDARLKLPQGVVPGERVEALEKELDEQKFDRAFDTLVMNQLAMPSERVGAKIMWDAGQQVWEKHTETLTAGQRFVGLNKRLRGKDGATDQSVQLNQALDEYMEKHPEVDAVEAAKRVFGSAKLSKVADSYVETIRLRQPVREPGSSRVPRG